jgi:hypothetical protein
LIALNSISTVATSVGSSSPDKLSKSNSSGSSSFPSIFHLTLILHLFVIVKVYLAFWSSKSFPKSIVLVLRATLGKAPKHLILNTTGLGSSLTTQISSSLNIPSS